MPGMPPTRLERLQGVPILVFWARGGTFALFAAGFLDFAGVKALEVKLDVIPPRQNILLLFGRGSGHVFVPLEDAGRDDVVFYGAALKFAEFDVGTLHGVGR